MSISHTFVYPSFPTFQIVCTIEYNWNKLYMDGYSLRITYITVFESDSVNSDIHPIQDLEIHINYVFHNFISLQRTIYNTLHRARTTRVHPSYSPVTTSNIMCMRFKNIKWNYVDCELYTSFSIRLPEIFKILYILCST